MTVDTRAAVAAIRAKTRREPRIGIVLGSGLGALANDVTEAVRIPYPEIPGFEKSTAPGHAGELVAGRLEGKDVAVMNGRFHYYEGYDPQAIARFARSAHARPFVELWREKILKELK